MTRILLINKRNWVPEDYFTQHSQNERYRRFQSIRFGLDYYLDNRNTFTLTQNFVKGRNRNSENQQQEFLDIDQDPDHTGQRASSSRFGFDRSNTQLIYRRTFVESGKTFGADISYNTGKGNDNTNISNAYVNPDAPISMILPASSMHFHKTMALKQSCR